MANYKTVFSGINGNEKPDTITVVQNAIETDLVFDCYNADGTAYVFSAGDVATAAFIQEGTTTPGYGSTGTITPLVGGSTLTWARAVEDVGTPARYALSFKIVGADTETDWSVPVLYTVIALPGAGDITPPSPLVGVSVAEAAWLTLAAQGVVYADIVQFNEAYVRTGLEPVGAQYWDSVREEMSFTVDDFGSITIGKEIWDKMTNLSGVQVVNGDVVSTASATGNRQAFTLTDATDTAKSIACIGMVTIPTINNNASGRITKSGIVRGLNTDAFTEGAIVYVDPLNPGKLTQTQPQAPDFTIAVGTVTVKHPTEGIINVNIRIVSKFVDSSDVNGTPLDTTGQFPVWDQTGMYFDFTSNVNDFDPAGSAAAAQAASLAIDGSNANVPVDIQGQSLAVGGAADVVQNAIKAHVTQTANVCEIQDKDGIATAVFDANGNFGVNKTSGLSQKFWVKGGVRIEDTSSTDYFTLSASGSFYSLQGANADNYFLLKNSSANTSPPSSFKLALQNTDSTAGNASGFSFLDAAGFTTSYFGSITVNQTTHEGEFVLFTRNSVGTLAERLRVDSGGNMSIMHGLQTGGYRIKSNETSVTTATVSDSIEVHFCNGAGAYALTLPAQVAGKTVRIINKNTGVVTLTPASGLISGAATKALNQYDSLLITSDGTNWY